LPLDRGKAIELLPYGLQETRGRNEPLVSEEEAMARAIAIAANKMAMARAMAAYQGD
jgi:hypothetical protein